ncbi:MAG TPA: hypothetical protein VHW60_17270 [Caulobacteraceae bacterium]|jgi:hypothetical protein|nr:hypothetical protein [Caulobacteraceae bacterium]
MTDTKDEPATGDEPRAERKAWIPPLVEVTLAPAEIQAGFLNSGADNVVYS